MANENDFYGLLGVSKAASAQEIRRSYRKLARKHHPDMNPGDAVSEERFKAISAAYDVLSDPAKRARYDEFGAAGLREGFDPEQARSYQRWSQNASARGGGAPFGAEGTEFDLGDMFGDFFGRGGGASRRRDRRGADMAATVEIDLAQALQGTEVRLQVPHAASCSVCSGSGAQPGSKAEPCGDCHGRGTVQAVSGPVNLRTRCPTCGGKGERQSPCSACGGSGKTANNDVVTVRIPPGADNGSKLRVPGRGAPGEGAAGSGDLVIETRVRPHPFFERNGLDLRLKLPITIAEAYNGANVEVPTPTGVVSLKVPPRSQQGSKLRLKGKGVKRGAQQGDLYVELNVRLPDEDTPAVAEAVRVLSSAYTHDVRSEVRL